MSAVETLIASAAARVGRPDADWRSAAGDIEQALKLDPERLELYRTLADYRRCYGDYAGAAAALGEFLKRKPRADAHVTRALMRAHLFDFKGALEDGTAAQALEPKGSGGCVAAAEAARGLGDLVRARREADRALELAPGNSWAWVVRAKVERDAGEREAALTDLEHALWLDPKSATAYGWRALVLRDAGRSVDALAAADASVRLDANSAWLTFLRGELKRDTGDLPGSWADITRAAATDPHASCDFDMLGDPARAFYRHPGNAWVHGWMGESLMAKGRFPEALAALDRSVALDSGIYWTRLWRGELHLLEKRFREAETELTRASELFPGLGVARLWRGEARQGLSDARGSAEDFAEAKRLSPELFA